MAPGKLVINPYCLQDFDFRLGCRAANKSTGMPEGGDMCSRESWYDITGAR